MWETYDLYCERLGPGLLAEPVNAATNAAFFVAAWLAWRHARRDQVATPGVRVLLLLIVAIGIGSFLFHTFAVGWARLADELPILLFQLGFLWIYVRRLLAWPRWGAALAIAAYLALALAARRYPHLLNGSLIYAPALLMTLSLGATHWAKRWAARSHMLIATALLVTAIALRTLDAAVCAAFPLGTHFLWHLMVATVAFLCLRALLARLAQMRLRS